MSARKYWWFSFVCFKRVMKWVDRIEISLESGNIYEMDFQIFAIWLCLSCSFLVLFAILFTNLKTTR